MPSPASTSPHLPRFLTLTSHVTRNTWQGQAKATSPVLQVRKPRPNGILRHAQCPRSVTSGLDPGHGELSPFLQLSAATRGRHQARRHLLRDAKCLTWVTKAALEAQGPSGLRNALCCVWQDPQTSEGARPGARVICSSEMRQQRLPPGAQDLGPSQETPPAASLDQSPLLQDQK